MLLNAEREKDSISKDGRSYKDHFTVQITEPYGNSWQGHVFGPLGGGSWTCQGGLPSGPLCGAFGWRERPLELSQVLFGHLYFPVFEA